MKYDVEEELEVEDIEVLIEDQSVNIEEIIDEQKFKQT